jgi:hypothetical protein
MVFTKADNGIVLNLDGIKLELQFRLLNNTIFRVYEKWLPKSGSHFFMPSFIKAIKNQTYNLHLPQFENFEP